MNIINVVHYLNHLHVIHLSEHIFKARGHGGSDKRGCTVSSCDGCDCCSVLISNMSDNILLALLFA